MKKNLLLFLLMTIMAFGSETKEKNATQAQKTIYYGEILSIESAMGYQYLKVKEDKKELWVAIANAPVKVGDRIGYDKRTIMKNFKSKSLKREFKEIIFASELYLPQQHSPSPIKDLKDMLGLERPQAKIVDAPNREKEEPSKPFETKDFYSVEEVFMWRDELKGKIISVKGVVHKVSKGIMKLDWVHIEDGTGDEKKRDDDLVFTIKEMPFKAGDKVIATGEVVTNKDFGYGYFYNVIIQNSHFKAR